MADNIEQRVAHRYMKDRDGETYFPMTHVDALLGLEQFDDSEDIENLSDLINNMKIKTSNLESRIDTLQSELSTAKEEVKVNTSEIKTLKEQIKNLINPAEGE